MSKDSPRVPQAPDPVAVANAQTASNLATANASATLNRTNQVTPWGNLTYSPGEPGPDGTPQWTATVSLSPDEQKLLSNSNQVSDYLSQLSLDQMGRVGQSLDQGLDFSKLPPMQSNVQGGALSTSVPTGNFQNSVQAGSLQNTATGQGDWTRNVNANPVQYAPSQGRNVQYASDTGQPISYGVNNNQRLQYGVQGGGVSRMDANGQPMVSNVSGGDISNVQGVDPLKNYVAPSNFVNRVDSQYDKLRYSADGKPIQEGLSVPADQLKGAMSESQKAAYNLQAQYLDADYGNRQSALENRLIQQGVVQGSEAWDKAMSQLGRERTFDYNNAFNNSFSTGLAANNQLFGQDLASGQFVNSAQSQGFQQNLANAQLSNMAQNQRFGQDVTNAGLYNDASDREFGQRMQSAQFYNQSQGQQFGQNATTAQLNNAAQSQGFNQNFSNAQLNNAVSGQNFNQELARTQVNNAAQQQNFGQGVTNAQLNNAAQQQQFGQQFSNAQLNNAGQSQAFDQYMGMLGANNAAQNQAYTQDMGRMQANNAAQAQQFGQGTVNAQLNNNARSQSFAESLAQSQLFNQAQNQQFGQGLANADLYNQVQQLLYGQQFNNAQLNNAAQAQEFGQGVTNANMSNQARSQLLQEMLLAQQNPLNMLNALRTGSQVTSPSFINTPQTNVAGTDIAGIQNTGYQNQLGQYNASQATKNAILSGLFGVGSAVAGNPSAF